MCCVRIIRQVYDITGDDARLRAGFQQFEKLRAEYPVRREFFNTELQLRNASVRPAGQVRRARLSPGGELENSAARIVPLFFGSGHLNFLESLWWQRCCVLFIAGRGRHVAQLRSQAKMTPSPRAISAVSS